MKRRTCGGCSAANGAGGRGRTRRGAARGPKRARRVRTCGPWRIRGRGCPQTNGRQKRCGRRPSGRAARRPCGEHGRFGGGAPGAFVPELREQRHGARRSRERVGIRAAERSRRAGCGAAREKRDAEGSAFSFGVASVIAGFRIADGVFHSGLGAAGGFSYPRASGRNGQRGQYGCCKNTLKGSHDVLPWVCLLSLRRGDSAVRAEGLRCRKERIPGRITLNA